MPTIAFRSSRVAGRMVKDLVPLAKPKLEHEPGPSGRPSDTFPGNESPDIRLDVVKTARRPEMKTAVPGPKAAELIARDARAMSPSFTRAYPFVMEKGEGCWVIDVDGNRFLDFTAGGGGGAARRRPPP